MRQITCPHCKNTFDWERTTIPVMRYADEPLMVAHLLGGANGVSFEPLLTGEDIKARVKLAIAYQQEIMQQLKELPRNAWD